MVPPSLIAVPLNFTLLHFLFAKTKDYLGGSRIRVFGQGNQVDVFSARLVRTKINVNGTKNKLRISPGTRLIDSVIVLSGDGHNVQIGSRCILGRMTLVLQSSSCCAIIGDFTTSASVNIDLGEPNLSLTIGKDCMISHRVEMMCGDAHSLEDLTTGDRLNQPRNVSIGDHVWLAAEVAILKGAVVGDHSTIGFRSVVTSAIPPHSLAVGIPARVIRSGVTWTRELPCRSINSPS